MKKNIVMVLTSVLFLIHSGQAQVPQAFNYQSVVRDSLGKPLCQKELSFRISIIKDAPEGDIVYREEHRLRTDAYGLIAFQIGMGERDSGSFSLIPWEKNKFFLKVEMDDNAGSDFRYMGLNPFFSVPYSQIAKSLESPVHDDQNLEIINDTLYIENGNFVDLTIYKDNRDEQYLTLKDDSLAISNANKVDLKKYLDNTDNQSLFLSGDTLGIRDGNYVIVKGTTYSGWDLNADTTSTSKRVGIGTQNPSTMLEIEVNQPRWEILKLRNKSYYYGTELLLMNDASESFGMGLEASGYTLGEGAYFITYKNTDILFYTNGVQERMRLTGEGKLGIGTPDPKRTVHINDVLRLEPRNTAPLNPEAGDMYFDSSLKKLQVYDGTQWQSCW
jgi:hypothetical protein